MRKMQFVGGAFVSGSLFFEGGYRILENIKKRIP